MVGTETVIEDAAGAAVLLLGNCFVVWGENAAEVGVEAAGGICCCWL